MAPGAGWLPGEDWVPAQQVDPRTASPARMYDYVLGGKDNYAADREAVERAIEGMGEVLASNVVWENRQFLIRAVRYLVGECGVRNIVDIGAGLPTQMNTHQAAHGIDPGVRIVYVDNDPVVLAHGRALLADNGLTTVLMADMRRPETILGQPDVKEMIESGESVAVLLVAVCHFLRDSDVPEEMVAGFRDALPSGSYVVISHLTTDGPPVDQVRTIEAAYEEASSPMVFRSRERIAGLFAGLELVGPGLVRPHEWHPDEGTHARTNYLYGAVGRTP